MGKPEANGSQGVKKPNGQFQMSKRERKIDGQRPPAIVASPDSIKKHLKVSELRNMAYWLLKKYDADIPAPRWALVQNMNAINSVVSVLVPGLSGKMLIADIEDPKPRELTTVDTEKLPALQEYFSQIFPTLSPRVRHNVVDASVSQFTSMPMSNKARKLVERHIKEAALEKMALAAEKGMEDAIVHQTKEFVLETPFLDFLGYPNKASSPSFVQLLEPQELSPDKEIDPRTFAVDCEMCETANGFELTRIAVIDMDEKVVYETLVKPDAEITNYLTRYSGITPELLEGVTTRLEDVQDWFLKNISSKDILVGHSLECDLKAMKMIHHTVIDTAIVYVDGRGLPSRPSLRWLASKYLDMEIQNHGENGHDPLEDARTCVKLLKLKQTHGPEFGAAKTTEVRLTKKFTESEIKCAVVDYGIPYWDEGNSQTVISATSDAEVVKNVTKCVKSGHKFVFAGLRELYQVKKRDGTVGDDVYESLNSNLRALLSSLPYGTAVILWSGGGDNTSLLDLERRRQSFTAAYEDRKAASEKGQEIELKEVWTEEQERLLAQAKFEATLGISLSTVITSRAQGDIDSAEPASSEKRQLESESEDRDSKRTKRV